MPFPQCHSRARSLFVPGRCSEKHPPLPTKEYGLLEWFCKLWLPQKMTIQLLPAGAQSIQHWDVCISFFLKALRVPRALCFHDVTQSVTITTARLASTDNKLASCGTGRGESLAPSVSPAIPVPGILPPTATGFGCIRFQDLMILWCGYVQETDVNFYCIFPDLIASNSPRSV